MFNGPDLLVRKFLSIDDSISRVGQASLSGIQDPTFLGFTIKFSYYNDEVRDSMGRVSPNYTMPGLLLDTKDIDSAYNYLKRVGKNQAAEYIKEFRKQLTIIENDKPWYFQSISGLEEVPKALDKGSYWRGKDKIITINCLESMDMQVSFLADLYRKGSYEQEFRRQLLPIDKRKFIMTVIIAEIRNISLLKEEIDQLAKETDIPNERIDGTKSEESEVPATKNSNPYQEQQYKNAIDSSDNRKTSEDSPIGGVSGSTDYAADSSEVNQTPTDEDYQTGRNYETEDYNKQIVGDQNYLENLAGRLDNVIKSANNLITFHVYKFFGCEFIFDEFPWLGNLTNTKPSEPASMKIKISWEDVIEENQYGFYNWILSDIPYFSAAKKGSEEAKILGSFENKRKNWRAWTHPDNPSFSYFKKDLRERFNINDPKKEAMKNSPATDDGFLAKAKKYGQAGQAAVEKYMSAGKKIADSIAPELGAELQKAEKLYYAKKNLIGNIHSQYSQGKDLFNKWKNLDFSDIEGIANMIDSSKKFINRVTGTLGLGNILPGNYLGNVHPDKATIEKSKLNREDIVASFRRNSNDDGHSPKGTWKNVDFRNDPSKDIKGPRNIYGGLRDSENDGHRNFGIWKSVGLTNESSFQKRIGDNMHGELKKVSNINWKDINFKDAPSLNKKTANDISPIEFDVPEKKTDIATLDFEVPEKKTDITPIEFNVPEKKTDITTLDFEVPEKKTDITTLDFEEPEKKTDITPIEFNVPEKKTDITTLDFEVPEKKTDITPLDFEVPEKKTDITTLDFEEPTSRISISSITLVNPGKRTEISPKNVGYEINKSNSRITPKNVHQNR